MTGVPSLALYRASLALDFGDPVDLTRTPVGLKLTTDEFPREGGEAAAVTAGP